MAQVKTHLIQLITIQLHILSSAHSIVSLLDQGLGSDWTTLKGGFYFSEVDLFLMFRLVVLFHHSASPEPQQAKRHPDSTVSCKRPRST